MGHDVRVVHFRSVFPTFFYFFAKILKRTLKKVFQTDFIPFERLNSRVEYIHEGIDVVSQPIFKVFPHVKFFNRTIRKQAAIIHSDNLNRKFTPDIIITHFINPQLPLVAELKKIYPTVKTSLVLHENPKVITDLFGANSMSLLANLDHVGFRFNEMKNEFVRLFGERHNMFVCPSGIPENYILDDIPTEKFRKHRLTFCFVGMLIPLKNIDILLAAFNKAFPNRECDLKIIGEGMLHGNIQNQIEQLKLADCVSQTGRMSRDEVQNVLSNVDVFVMVSKPEAFGLVYLEAMGKGCLTVGTKGQGIDGVIQNDINGFLSEARNVDELSLLLERIYKLSYEEKMIIAKKGHNTALNLTDRKVAVSYLEKLGVK